MVNGTKGMGENIGGVEQSDKDKARSRIEENIHIVERVRKVKTEKEQYQK